MPEPRVNVEEPVDKSVEAGPPAGNNDRRGSAATYNTNDRKMSAAALLRNPLAGMSDEDIIADVDAFCAEKGLMDHVVEFRKGGLLARNINTPYAFEQVDSVPEEEKVILRREITHKWSQPFKLYFLCLLCAGSAIVQGMDQTAVNGAQVWPPSQCV